MNKPQISTNVGTLSILSGFLAIYQDVKIVEFMEVFKELTYGDVTTMVAPFVIGLIAWFHNEDS